MKKKSLKINGILNGIKTIMSMIFPIITFPYISRVLQVDNIGKINFSNSIINYFLIIAGLGISTYAIREGSRLRDSREKLNQFANQVFTINMISTFCAYILLATVTFGTPKLHSYIILIAIQSINIFGATIGINWLYIIYEDYLYITIRTISFQIVSLILLFSFVHDINDYIIYAWISVFANSGANILNYIHSKKYVDIRLTTDINIKKHIGPIMVLFSSAIATTVYVDSDLTMLGFMTSDYNVGLYSTSAKMYSIIKSLLASIILVTLPRLSNYIANKKFEDFKKVIYDIFDIFLIILLPTVVGLFLTASDVILIFAGESYLEAVPSMQILSIGLLFSILSIYYTNAILLPMKYEKVVLLATVVGAAVNITLNFVLIKVWSQNGAAFATVIAEILVFVVQYISVRNKLPIKINFKDLLSVAIGCIVIIVICISIDQVLLVFWLKFALKIIISVIVYFVTLFTMKNKIFLSLIDGTKGTLHKKH